MPRLVVSIINFRTPDLTIACVLSVLRDLSATPDARDAEVVIVDNASNDGSVEHLADWIDAHPDDPVRLIRSSLNTGFSGGHNQVIESSDADYVLLLNSDAELRVGCLAKLLAAAERDKAAGLFGPALEGEDGTPQTSFFRWPSALSELERGASLGPVTALLSRWVVPLGPEPETDEIGWTAFACVLLRRAMIDQIGPLDEGYFLYFEDVEYCLRAKRAGWTVGHAPAARALHHIGGSTGVTALQTQHLRRPAFYYAGRSRYFFQAYGRFGLLAANVGWTLGRALSWTRFLFGKGRPAGTAHEARDIWINFAQPLGPRHAPPDAEEPPGQRVPT
ncbi:MAG: glycosyltransferase family 2 protein [Pseudomonadota bacterium]